MENKAIAFLPNTQDWHVQFVDEQTGATWGEPVLGFVLHNDGEITAASIDCDGYGEADVSTVGNFVRLYKPTLDNAGEMAKRAAEKIEQLKKLDAARKARAAKKGVK